MSSVSFVQANLRHGFSEAVVVLMPLCVGVSGYLTWRRMHVECHWVIRSGQYVASTYSHPHRLSRIRFGRLGWTREMG